MYCSQYVLWFADQHGTFGVLQRCQARRPHQRSNSLSPLMANDEELNGARVLGEKIQGVAIDRGSVHVDIWIALLPLREATVELRPRKTIAVGHSVTVMNIGV